jgi:N-acetylglucosamine kinase-like BadF-type ATPase
VSHLVGVDSGGTHTNIRILAPGDKSARTIAEIDKSLSTVRSPRELLKVFRDVLSAVQLHTLGNPASIWINSAGYSAATKNRFRQLLHEAADGFNGRIGICNDAVGLLLARHSELVVVICGTGSVAMARSANNEIVSRGGDEWVATDYGSAFWLGLSGIRAAYRALEGGADTALLNCLVEEFGRFRDEEGSHDSHVAVREISRRLASLGTDTKPIIASFAPQVTRQAELGDDEALKIVRTAVDELAGTAARVYRDLTTRAEGRVVAPLFLLTGSVAYRSPFYAEAFKASLDQFLFDVRDSTGRPIELERQLNGLAEALDLAARLDHNETIPDLGPHHSFSLYP